MFSVAWHHMMVFAEFTINIKGLSNHKSFVIVFFLSFYLMERHLIVLVTS